MCSCIECIGDQPEPQECSHCGGSGDQYVMGGRGPDAVEEVVACEWCGGTGVVPGRPM
jgi:DnaJ-class molecular chaperone